MKSNRLFRPDFIVALLAVVIGLSTMFVYIYQAQIMSRQVHATTWPFLETNFSEGDNGFWITVSNKGVGPAIVKKVFVVIDGQRTQETRANIDSLASKLIGVKKPLNGYTNLVTRVISAGEEIRFIEINDSANVKKLMSALAKSNVKIEICYCSVLGDCWTIAGSKTTECKSCD